MPPKNSNLFNIEPNSKIRFLPPMPKEHSVMHYQTEMNPEDVLRRIQNALPMIGTLSGMEQTYVNVGTELLNSIIAHRAPQQRVVQIPVGHLNAEDIDDLMRSFYGLPPIPIVKVREKMFGMFYPIDKQLELGNAIGK